MVDRSINFRQWMKAVLFLRERLIQTKYGMKYVSLYTELRYNVPMRFSHVFMNIYLNQSHSGTTAIFPNFSKMI